MLRRNMQKHSLQKNANPIGLFTYCKYLHTPFTARYICNNFSNNVQKQIDTIGTSMSETEPVSESSLYRYSPGDEVQLYKI